MPSSNFVVSSLPDYVQNNKDLIIKNFALVGTASRQRFGLQTGIKTSAYLNYLELAPVLQDGKGCGFSASGTATLTQRTITTAIIKVNMDICPDSLLGKYPEYLVRIGANSDELPFEQYIIDGITAELNKKIEKLIWQGDTTRTTDTDLKWINGILKQLASDTDKVADMCLHRLRHLSDFFREGEEADVVDAASVVVMGRYVVLVVSEESERILSVVWGAIR